MSVDDLEAAGIERMDAPEIDGFLATQRSGVLGLPTEDVPYLLPLSYGYDGAESVYFTYIMGADSRKGELSERADSAAFLVYSVSSPFQWESVLLEGTLTAVPPAEYEAVTGQLSEAWRPEVFDDADLEEDVELYRLAITHRSGLKHTGLPPGLEGVPDAA